MGDIGRAIGGWGFKKEIKIRTLLEEAGYDVVKPGWPDLMVLKDERLVAVVEVKGIGGEPTETQDFVLRRLAERGIESMVVQTNNLSHESYDSEGKRRAAWRWKNGSVQSIGRLGKVAKILSDIFR